MFALMKKLVFACAAAVSSFLVLNCRGAAVTVDLNSPVGPVKPVNGVGQPPMQGLPKWGMLMHYLKEAGIPYARLHDVGGLIGGGVYVDIPNVFPNFAADENDPASYDFAFTDALLRELTAHGVEPFYRLGVTIENFIRAGIPHRRAVPPPDFAKWARICEHVIRHYTEGWANGSRHKITYWEIWNEPDNHIAGKDNPLWDAPFSEYIRFYGVVAPYLKTKFPHLKIGGYGSCGFYAAVNASFVPGANSSPQYQHFVTCAKDFLSAARANSWPLDFFSFHSYSNPDEAIRQVKYADWILNEYGFTSDRTERIYNEWLPYVAHESLGTAKQATGIATELIELQNGPCDVACIYDARCGVGNYAPLFNPLTYKPHKAYYAYTAFNELRKRGTAVKTTADGTKGFHACAAKGTNGLAVFVANDTDGAMPLTVAAVGWTVAKAVVTDDRRTAVEVNALDELPPRSFALLSLRKAAE